MTVEVPEPMRPRPPRVPTLLGPERGRCEVDDNGAGSPADIIVSPVGVVATPSALRASGHPIPDRCRRMLHFENVRKAQ